MADNDQKSEKPTQRRVLKAREEGQFATARVFVSSIHFLAFVALLHTWGPQWAAGLKQSFAGIMEHALDPKLNPMDVVYVGFALLKQTLVPLGVMGGILILITIGIQLLVTRFGISARNLTPDFKRLNPVTRMRKLPKQNLSSLLQAIIMLPVFGIAVYRLVGDNLEAYLTLPLRNLAGGATQFVGSIESLLWKAALLFVVFGAVDLVRQKSRYEKDLMMSKQEIRDESKELNGNPLIKARVRRLRRDMARRRMMHEIPTATAVIVNPTHYAVALKYQMDSRSAPKVVAKGKNYLALRIRQKALENQVPLIENPPLAQGLYKAVDVGQEIPPDFYKAVAEVLAYIFRVVNGRRSASRTV